MHLQFEAVFQELLKHLGDLVFPGVAGDLCDDLIARDNAGVCSRLRQPSRTGQLFDADIIGQHDYLVQAAIGNVQCAASRNIERWHVAFCVVAGRCDFHRGDFKFGPDLRWREGSECK